MLEIRQVCKQFPKSAFALQKVTCNLSSGLHVLAGPNGSGKSTLLRIAAGIMRPDTGNIFFAEQDVYASLPRYKYKLGYLPQTFSFYSHMTGMDFLLYLANLKGIFGESAKKRARYVADLLTIHQHCPKKISTWSVGLRQRLGIAQALLNDPDILILDEPLCGLAPQESTEIQNLLSHLAEKKIILVSSHLIDDLPLTKLLLLVKGSLAFSGLPSIFIDQAKEQKRLTQPNSTAIYTKDDCCLRIITTAKPAPATETALPTLEEAYLIWLERLKRNEADV